MYVVVVAPVMFVQVVLSVEDCHCNNTVEPELAPVNLNVEEDILPQPLKVVAEIEPADGVPEQILVMIRTE